MHMHEHSTAPQQQINAYNTREMWERTVWRSRLWRYLSLEPQISIRSWGTKQRENISTNNWAANIFWDKLHWYTVFFVSICCTQPIIRSKGQRRAIGTENARGVCTKWSINNRQNLKDQLPKDSLENGCIGSLHCALACEHMLLAAERADTKNRRHRKGDMGENLWAEGETEHR